MGNDKVERHSRIFAAWVTKSCDVTLNIYDLLKMQNTYYNIILLLLQHMIIAMKMSADMGLAYVIQVDTRANVTPIIMEDFAIVSMYCVR